MLVIKEEVRERPRKLRLTHTSWAQEHERTGWTIRVRHASARAAYSVRYGANRVHLPNQALTDVGLHGKQLLHFALQQPARGDSRPCFNHGCDFSRTNPLGNHRLALIGVILSFLRLRNLGLNLGNITVL